MANNKQYLKVPSSEQARKNGQKGGIASAKKAKERKEFKELLNIALDEITKHPKTKEEITTKELIVARLVLQASAGDLKAIEMIRDQIGEKPTDKLEIGGKGDSPINIKFIGVDIEND